MVGRRGLGEGKGRSEGAGGGEGKEGETKTFKTHTGRRGQGEDVTRADISKALGRRESCFYCLLSFPFHPSLLSLFRGRRNVFRNESGNSKQMQNSRTFPYGRPLSRTPWRDPKLPSRMQMEESERRRTEGAPARASEAFHLIQTIKARESRMQSMWKYRLKKVGSLFLVF